MQARALRLITVILIAASLLACTKKDQHGPSSPGRGQSTHPKGRRHDAPHDTGRDKHGRKHEPAAAKHGPEGPHDAGTAVSADAPVIELSPVDAGKEIFAP